jgi:hypothetical protein
MLLYGWGEIKILNLIIFFCIWIYFLNPLRMYGIGHLYDYAYKLFFFIIAVHVYMHTHRNSGEAVNNVLESFRCHVETCHYNKIVCNLYLYAWLCRRPIPYNLER